MNGRWPSTTPLGHIEYLVLLLGLTNAPAIFQALIKDVLRDYLNLFLVFIYLNDILIFSKSPPEHIEHVQLVLWRPLENGFYIKAEKCEFHAFSK